MSIYSFLLKLGGVDVESTYGFHPIELRGNWDGPAVKIDETTIPGADGSVETTDDETYEPRDFIAIGELIGDDDEQDFEDQLDALKAGVTGKLLAVLAGNQESRQRVGRVLKVDADVSGSHELDTGKVQIRIRCFNPLAYATSATTVTGLVNVDVECELGTARSRPVVTVTGATGPFDLILKNNAGTEIARCTINASGTVVVDSITQTILDDAVRADDALTAGDFLILHPRDNGATATDGPTIRTTSGSISITYTPAFL